MDLDELLKIIVKEEASDLHLKPMRAPLLRMNGRLQPLEGAPLQPDMINEMIYRVLTDKQRAHLEENLSLDFAYSLKGVSRFRGAIYFQRGTIAAVFRRVPFQFPTLEEWGLPEVLKQLALLPHGLVLLAGPAGSGKSSTLTAIVKEILATRPVHIVSIEDPIEFLVADSVGSMSQREVGTDVKSFADGLKNSLRQDPDVIVVGEMIDPETIATVMTAAETGHLVFSTVHSSSAVQTVERIVGSFPDSQQKQTRIKLGHVLEAVIALQLVERASGEGMVAAVEIMRKNSRVTKLISEGVMLELGEEIEASVSFEKMQSMNQSLTALVLNGVISREVALTHSPSPGDLDLEIRKFLKNTGAMSRDEENTMADSQADFSKILELREIRHAHEEAQERHRQDMADKDELIASLREELRGKESSKTAEAASLRSLLEERQKLTQQLAFQKQEYDAKIEKLQLRIKELTTPAGVLRK